MKIRMLYQCEKCGVEYKTEELAQECENMHLKPEYVEEEYRAGKSIPKRLKVGFSDDSVGIYELVKMEEVQSDV